MSKYNTEQSKAIKKALLDNLAKGNGIVNSINNAGISIPTFYEWCKADKNFNDAIEKTKTTRCVILESAMYKNAIEGNVTMQIFLACNWMPDKYHNLNRIEYTGNNGEPFKIEIKSSR